MTGTDAHLRQASRCVLAVPAAGAPLLSPMMFWSDGAAFWMTTASSAAKVARLRRRPRCAVYVPQIDPEAPATVVTGTARVYSLDDPVGLALHGAPIAAAMGALAVKSAAEIVGYSRDLARVPVRWLPRNRVVLRIRIDGVERVRPPRVGDGLAPALPGVVPADVRRAVAGRREILLATDEGQSLRLYPAVWGAGYAIEMPAGATPSADVAAAAVVEADPVDRPGEARGVTVGGRLGVDDRLHVERVTWWRGFHIESAPVDPEPAGGLVLPE